jgi:hypothetical protein
MALLINPRHDLLPIEVRSAMKDFDQLPLTVLSVGHHAGKQWAVHTADTSPPKYAFRP